MSEVDLYMTALEEHENLLPPNKYQIGEQIVVLFYGAAWTADIISLEPRNDRMYYRVELLRFPQHLPQHGRRQIYVTESEILLPPQVD